MSRHHPIEQRLILELESPGDFLVRKCKLKGSLIEFRRVEAESDSKGIYCMAKEIIFSR